LLVNTFYLLIPRIDCISPKTPPVVASRQSVALNGHDAGLIFRPFTHPAKSLRSWLSVPWHCARRWIACASGVIDAAGSYLLVIDVIARTAERFRFSDFRTLKASSGRHCEHIDKLALLMEWDKHKESSAAAGYGQLPAAVD
jgi:hypothetical protein